MRTLASLWLLLASAALPAQPTTHVSGVVYDSLARIPLAGALVQLVGVSAGKSVAMNAGSDSLGRFTIDSVPEGKYTLGFYHPVLDTLGIEPTLREVVVTGTRAVRADIGIPSAVRLRSAICKQAALSDSGGMVVGTVRNATDRSPVNGASITAEWVELVMRRGGMDRNTRRITATTGENGWFAMCNVPTGGTMTVLASKGRDSTSVLELQIPSDGFVRRELYLGTSRALVTGSVTSTDGRPITGARVAVSHGTEARTNERGEFSIGNAMAGTRMLEVRAVGYYPEIRPLDVVNGAPAVRVAMTSMKTVLDTIRVTAVAITRGILGFEERSRSGPGRYTNADQIARLNPNTAAQIFQNMGGVKLMGDMLMMRGMFPKDVMKGDFNSDCAAAVYLDGMRIPSGYDSTMKPLPLSVDEIDSWVAPTKIAGIEVYTPGTVPSEFSDGMNGCGAIVIWRKR